MNEKAFFAQIRETLFHGKLTQGVVETVQAFAKAYTTYGRGDYRDLAYILATAYHEVYHAALNSDWAPIREGFAQTNEGAVRAVTSLYEKERISKNYALPDANGNSWYGRGFEQVTHYANYLKMEAVTGLPLTKDPDLLLQRPIAAQVIVQGMMGGYYTGKALRHYITNVDTDFVQARRIINPGDARTFQKVAATADKFYAALIQK
ncbi:hypothetical protein I2I11_04255 [Pontibacter sp. 172403-2]|uniref:hypothetical protein n=1 Tax=Pontibacter rufus TaxID=2791028 RepID=UPI0018AF6BDF|nr:hypothetical protein [Pontibacter sp. 172403-2]MBF9252497.1 hypothetical protein [Pontibacter sp. 172403-2]